MTVRGEMSLHELVGKYLDCISEHLSLSCPALSCANFGRVIQPLVNEGKLNKHDCYMILLDSMLSYSKGKKHSICIEKQLIIFKTVCQLLVQNYDSHL